MPVSSALRELNSIAQALLLTVDGLPVAWTDNANLAAQADYCGDGRVLHNGLKPPTYTLRSNIIEGELEADRIAFSLLDDSTGYLAALFAAVNADEAELPFSVRPDTDLTSETDLHDHWIDLEAIGPDGERGYYSFVPELVGAGIGSDHVGRDRESASLRVSTVSPAPTLMAGRRVALWRVYRDRVLFPDSETQGWRPWDECDLLWFGTLEDAGFVERRSWSLDCSGPGSFLRGNLGLTASSTGYEVSGGLPLNDDDGADESRIGISFATKSVGPTDDQYHGSLNYSTTITGPTRDDLMTALRFAVEFGRIAGGPDGAFQGSPGSDFMQRSLELLEDGSFAIRIEATVTGPVYYAEVLVSMHRRSWAMLGYDVDLQRSIEDAPPGFICPFQIHTRQRLGGHRWETTTVDAPGPDYVTLIVSTIPESELRKLDTIRDDDEFDNAGAVRIYKPIHNGSGSTSLQANLGPSGQLVSLGFGDRVVHPGQHDRPPYASRDNGANGIDVDGSEADTQGIFLFVGPRRFEGEDAFTEVQLGVCSWARLVGQPELIAGEPSKVRVMRWLDPPLYGINRPMLSSDWVALDSGENAIRAYPVFRLGYCEHDVGVERWDIVLQRMLLTTGTSEGWTGFEGQADATIDAGDNEPAVTSRFGLDVEIAPLGLAVPRSLVADVREWADVYDALPPGIYLDTWGLMVRPGFGVYDFVSGLAKSLGLCWCLRGGRLGLFDPTAPVTIANVEHVITQSNVRSMDNPQANVTRQQLRATAPIATWKLSYGREPVESAFRLERVYSPRPRSVRGNAYGQEWSADGYGINEPGAGTGYEQRVNDVATFYERRQFLIRDYPMMRHPGKDLFPGSRVAITDPQVVGQDGTYGVVAYLGYIVAKTEDLQNDAISVDILVQDSVARTQQLTAPVAVSEGIDTTNNRIYVRDNWSAIPTPGHLDCNGFVEPAGSALGGNASIEGWWVGDTTHSSTPDWTGTVSSVNAVAGSCHLQLTGAVSGTYRRDRTYFVVMRPTQSAAWVQALIAVVANEDFDTPRTRWSDG